MMAITLQPPTFELARSTLARILQVKEEQLRLLAGGCEVSDLSTEITDLPLTCETPDIAYMTPAYHKLMRRAREYTRLHPVAGQKAKEPKATKTRVMKKPGRAWDTDFGRGKSSIHIPAATDTESSADSSSISDMSAIYRNDGTADKAVADQGDDDGTASADKAVAVDDGIASADKAETVDDGTGSADKAEAVDDGTADKAEADQGDDGTGSASTSPGFDG